MQKKTILIALGSLLTLAAFIFFPSNTEEKIIGLKSTIHHDDFEYSVQDLQILDKIGNQQARGKFYVLTFQVENRAKECRIVGITMLHLSQMKIIK